MQRRSIESQRFRYVYSESKVIASAIRSENKETDIEKILIKKHFTNNI